MAARSSGKTMFSEVKPKLRRCGKASGVRHRCAHPHRGHSGAETILQQDIRCKFTIGSGLQEFLVDDGDVPFGEIFGGHGELAGGESQPLPSLGAGAAGEGVTKVAGGVGVPRRS